MHIRKPSDLLIRDCILSSQSRQLLERVRQHNCVETPHRAAKFSLPNSWCRARHFRKSSQLDAATLVPSTSMESSGQLSEFRHMSDWMRHPVGRRSAKGRRLCQRLRGAWQFALLASSRWMAAIALWQAAANHLLVASRNWTMMVYPDRFVTGATLNSTEEQPISDGHEQLLREILSEIGIDAALDCPFDEFVRRLKNAKSGYTGTLAMRVAEDQALAERMPAPFVQLIKKLKDGSV